MPMYPIGGTYEFCIIQIPTSFPTLPRRGIVGHIIDRYIELLVAHEYKNSYICTWARMLIQTQTQIYAD